MSAASPLKEVWSRYIFTVPLGLAMATAGLEAMAETPSAIDAHPVEMRSCAVRSKISQPGAVQSSPGASTSPVPAELPGLRPAVAPGDAPLPAPLFDFHNSEIKFKLSSLMNTLRDSRHEGWVLAPYPDPTTSRPLIGAGFSLDVPATEHLQRDPLNPHSFIEPSSAQLWQAAGLDPARLPRIIEQFDRDLDAWEKKGYRKRMKHHRLPPILTEEEGTRLLRISAIQAIYNARAYCRDFDELTASQQMALSELVFQMGVNLEEFVQFLGALNDGLEDSVLPANTMLPRLTMEREREHWKLVQKSLIESQWAVRYTSRAAAVIAMFDRDYLSDPKAAERRVLEILRPPAANLLRVRARHSRAVARHRRNRRA